MRYHFDKPKLYANLYGEVYECNHPVYNRCTLYTIGDKGLAVIQQRYDPETKKTWWGEIDPWLTDAIYLRKGFKDFFMLRARLPVSGIYPSISVRQIMWALKMKPIPRERWETVFDRKDV